MLSVGSLLQNGKYQIDEVLSQSHGSILYRATCNLLSQPIVLKTFQTSNESVENVAQREKFLAESQRLSELKHPHLVTVTDCFVEDNQPFMAMEWVAGQNLAQRLIEGPLPESEALGYTRQIGQGLIVLHDQGLLHGAVRPHHIIVQPETQTAILVNFDTGYEGLLDQTQLNPEDPAVGFASPEQYSDPTPAAPSTDVYGLAATLYALVTGQSPIAAVLRDRTPLPSPRELNPNLNPQIERAILAGMDLNLENRTTGIEAWLTLLPDIEASAALKGQPMQEPPETDALESPAAVPEPSKHQSSEEPQMPTPKDRAAQHPPSQNAARPSVQRIYTVANLPTPAFPKRALLWCAAIAGLGGAGFGFYLRSQLFAPLLTPNQSPLSSPKEKIEESFPPKDRPKIYDTAGDDAGLNTATPLPTNNPDFLETPQTPPIEGTLEPQNSSSPIPNPAANSTDIPQPQTTPIKPRSQPSPPPQPQSLPSDNDFSPSPDLENPIPPSAEEPISPSQEFSQEASPNIAPQDPISTP